MEAIQRLLIESACKNLVTRYSIELDSHNIDGFIGLFSQDAVWELVNDNSHRLVGQDAMRNFAEGLIAKFIERRLHVLHLMQNIHIEVKSATEAEGYSIGLILEGPRGELPIPVRGIEMITEYRDRYRLGPDGWRIVHRSMSKLLDKKSPAFAA